MVQDNTQAQKSPARQEAERECVKAILGLFFIGVQAATDVAGQALQEENKAMEQRRRFAPTEPYRPR